MMSSVDIINDIGGSALDFLPPPTVITLDFLRRVPPPPSKALEHRAADILHQLALVYVHAGI